MSIKQGLFQYNEVKKGWLITVKDAGSLVKLAENTYRAGVKMFDCFSPFPIHGLDKAMGLPSSTLPFVVLVTSIMAGCAIFGLFAYIDVFGWALNLGGKPNFVWPAYMPVTYEVITMTAGFASVGTLVFVGRLWDTKRQSIKPEVTSDTFVLWIADDLSETDIAKICSNYEVKIEKIG